MAWTRGPVIGRGSSAAVSLAAFPDGGFFAVKSADLSSSVLLQKEESLISQLCSPYIVKCFGSDITRENNEHVFNVFLEYVPGGTLSDFIRTRGGALEETAICFYAHQLLRGLDYLHRRGIAHCDLKPQNVLLAGDALRIADFGCARRVGESALFSGTPAYMAPEAARGEDQGFAADVWALGCTVIEMATGAHPWPEMRDPAAAIYRIGFSGDVPEFPKWLSSGAKDLLGKCLVRDPNERWTAGDLLQHPFFDSMEENCGEIVRKSPTSVIDGGFWNDLDASESPLGTVSYPAGRIRGLIGGDVLPTKLSVAGWVEEEEWLTVRDNGGLVESETETETETESPAFFSVEDDVTEPSDLTEESLNGRGGNGSANLIVSVNDGNFVFRKAIVKKSNSLSNIPPFYFSNSLPLLFLQHNFILNFIKLTLNQYIINLFILLF